MSTVQKSRDLVETTVGTGMEWVVDASGCSVSSLRNSDLIQRICRQVVADIGVKVVGEPQFHRFDGPGGVTALYMLSESHLACHTYPEYGLATFNLYCCRERAAWDWQGMLSKMLDAKIVQVRQLSRGRSQDAARPAGSGELGFEGFSQQEPH
ncbi:MAG TPA: S-adenosylmethionine decarboxylase [Rhodopirellula sp.]|nr:MAG: hypothetical protein CBD74_12080 [Saprospirales bacterium TMED214]HBV64207.1 S-adenosylmethionine decarboxylase [Rhodopirellula sp.]